MVFTIVLITTLSNKCFKKPRENGLKWFRSLQKQFIYLAVMWYSKDALTSEQDKMRCGSIAVLRQQSWASVVLNQVC